MAGWMSVLFLLLKVILQSAGYPCKTKRWFFPQSVSKSGYVIRKVDKLCACSSLLRTNVFGSPKWANGSGSKIGKWLILIVLCFKIQVIYSFGFVMVLYQSQHLLGLMSPLLLVIRRSNSMCACQVLLTVVVCVIMIQFAQFI